MILKRGRGGGGGEEAAVRGEVLLVGLVVMLEQSIEKHTLNSVLEIFKKKKKMIHFSLHCVLLKCRPNPFRCVTRTSTPFLYSLKMFIRICTKGVCKFRKVGRKAKLLTEAVSVKCSSLYEGPAKLLSLGSDYFSATFYQTYFYYKPSKYSPFTETHFVTFLLSRE